MRIKQLNCRRDSKFEAKKEKLTTTSTGVETLSEELESKGHIVVQLRRGFDALEEKLKDIDPGEVSIYKSVCTECRVSFLRHQTEILC